MSTAKGVASLLQKLDNALGKNRKKSTNDYKALSEERKKAFTKCVEGKNQFVFIKPEGFEDPFIEWGYHAGLQEISYYSIPCDALNKGEDCLICNIVESLQKENFEGNKHIWMPIQLKTEFYAPVVNVTSEETKKEGIKWLKLSKTIMDGMTTWIRNTEEGESLFFEDDDPQKVIINYTKDALPKDKYSIDKKNTTAFSAQQLADWRGQLKPVGTYLLSKSQDEVKKIVDSYFERIEQMVKDAEATASEQEELKTTPPSDVKATSKLASLKKNS